MALYHPTHILKVTCKDQPGIVSFLSTSLFQAGCNIVDSHQYSDPDTGLFFIRFEICAASPDIFDTALEKLSQDPLNLGLSISTMPYGKPIKTLIMVSKFGHCLNDLLFRFEQGQLNLDLKAVVSNHPTFEKLVTDHGLPFHHIPITKETKEQAETELLELVDSEEIDLIILARYMQILSPKLCTKLHGKVINIHHSFLPSFKGAKPYHQAHQRGVKLIGATAHYVTSDLDEGPIIEQEIQRVTHAYSPQELVQAGQDIENIVLARAVKYHSEHRVFLNGHKTIIFK